MNFHNSYRPLFTTKRFPIMAQFVDDQYEMLIPNTLTAKDIYKHLKAAEDAVGFESIAVGDPFGKQIGYVQVVFGDGEQFIDVSMYRDLAPSNRVTVSSETVGEEPNFPSTASENALAAVVECLEELEVGES